MTGVASARRAAGLGMFVLFGLLACASEQQSDFVEDEATDGGRGGLSGLANGSSGLPLSGTTSKPGGGAPTLPNGAGAGGSAGNAGRAGSAGTASVAAGGRAGSGGSAGATGTGTAGAAGTLNQPTKCDEATATVLGTMNSNITVASNACLKMTLPTEQTWIKKLTLQPDSGMYPLPFSWSNCGTNSTGVLTANYANSVLDPVTAQCPIFVKLGGNGSPVNVQWWGG